MTHAPARSPRIYLDHNATTPLCEEAARAMREAIDGPHGNPSSVHREGRLARDAVERARRQIAELLSCDPESVVFTASGTEADFLGIVGGATASRDRGAVPRVLTTAIEHPAVAGACAQLGARGFDVEYLPLSPTGVVDIEAARSAIEAGAALVALSLANHESGVLQPAAELAAIAGAVSAHVHVDAVQVAGRMALDVSALGADSIAISAHKFYGPKGVGVLVTTGSQPIEPAIVGGHQERGRRPGTENVIGIAGAGAAAQAAAARIATEPDRLAALTATLERGLSEIEGVRVVASDADRVPGTTLCAIAGALGEVVVQALDLSGFAVSTGAACTSGTLEPSPVVLGMGESAEVARSVVRISLGRGTTAADIAALLDALPQIVARARQFR